MDNCVGKLREGESTEEKRRDNETEKREREREKVERARQIQHQQANRNQREKKSEDKKKRRRRKELLPNPGLQGITQSLTLKSLTSFPACNTTPTPSLPPMAGKGGRMLYTPSI